jgi:hypothetical protein
VEGALKLALRLASEFALAKTQARIPPKPIAAALLTTVAALTGLAALGCGVAALWLACQSWLGPVGAALITGVVLLVIGLGAALAARRPSRVEPPRAGPGLDDLLRSIDASNLCRDYKTEFLLGAALIGLLVGSGRAGSPPPADHP